MKTIKIFVSLLFLHLIVPGIVLSQGFDYSKYGKEFVISANIKKGGWMDVAISGNTLFAIGGNSLYSFNLSSPNNPVLLDSIAGLGGVRQIEIESGFAYITSRTDGLYIVNVENPGQLELTSHYDAIECATGVAVSGKIAVLTNRIYGVELIDISDPYNPLFLSTELTDEAQSVFIHDNYAFVGDWASKKVIIIDIKDPEKPEIISDVMVDGYPDGIFTKGNLCFVSTGHHGMGLIKHEETDPAWGKGHGFEIIDIKNPLHPKVISRLKLPVFYINSPDWWDVQVAGDYAFVGDSKAGIFIISVINPESPEFIGYAKLPSKEDKNESGLVNGFAIGSDVIYVAGAKGLYLVYAKNIAKPFPKEKSAFDNYTCSNHIIDHSSYYTGTQVHSAVIDSTSESVLIAAGSAGVHKISLFPQVSGSQILDQGHEVYDICLVSDKLYIAEGLNGLSAWEFHSGKIGKLIGRYQSPKGGIYQVVIENVANIAALHVKNTLEFVDISEPANMFKIFEDNNPHLMYKNPISKQIFDSRYFGCMWLGDCYLYEIQKKGEIKKIGKIFSSIGGWNVSFGPINGFNVIDNKALALCGDGLIVKNSLNDEKFKLICIDGMKLTGKPTLSGSNLYSSDRRTGLISALDITNLNSPKKLWQCNIEGNPGFVIPYKDMLIVPAGNGGLQILKANSGEPYY